LAARTEAIYGKPPIKAAFDGGFASSKVLARPVANPVLTNKKRRIAPSLGKALHPASQWLHLA
jgi:hypothetical protein